MIFVRLLVVVLVLSGCRQQSENNIQKVPVKNEAETPVNQSEIIATTTTTAVNPPPTTPVVSKVQPVPGPPVVVELPDVVVPAGYVGLPRLSGGGGPGLRRKSCPVDPCPGFVEVSDECPGFVEPTVPCPGFISVD